VIIREGEFSDSVFLIGTGSVQVVLQGKDGYEINISTLGKGEFFGEMASVERIPRSATVIARENSTLLEVNGEKFCDIMRENPIVAFNVLLKLSERLRHVSEHVLAVKLRDADEKINLFNIKLDAELKAVEASLKAAQAVFEQTKMRTDEVISSAERSTARFTIIGSAIGGFATVVISVFTWVGVGKFQDIMDVEKKMVAAEEVVNKIKNDIEKTKQGLTVTIADANEKFGNISKTEKEVEELSVYLNKLVIKIKEISKDSLLDMYYRALEAENTGDTIEYFGHLLKLKDSALTYELLTEIETKIDDEKYRNIYKRLLSNSLAHIEMPENKIKAYYLFLTVLILDNKYKEPVFKETFTDFEKYVGNYEGPRIKENLDLSHIDDLFMKQDQEKYDLWFKDIKPLIP
jgi:CRP-like cAMP-binding protein